MLLTNLGFSWLCSVKISRGSSNWLLINVKISFFISPISGINSLPTKQGLDFSSLNSFSALIKQNGLTALFCLNLETNSEINFGFIRIFSWFSSWLCLRLLLAAIKPSSIFIRAEQPSSWLFARFRHLQTVPLPLVWCLRRVNAKFWWARYGTLREFIISYSLDGA